MKNVCVLGCGRLGQIIADGLHTGKVKGCRLEGVMDGNEKAVKEAARKFQCRASHRAISVSAWPQAIGRMPMPLAAPWRAGRAALYNRRAGCYNKSDRPVGRSEFVPAGEQEENSRPRVFWREDMLPQFSVRKPYTVLVAVVLVLVLGVISFTGMTTDLLPAMELPYVVVMTTYPGASPEKIETTVTKPLEAVLGTTGGIKNVSSVSSENASIVILEFEQGTNMDSAMIELSSNVDLVSGQMDDAVGTPMLMKISPDMLPVMVASVDMDGMDVKEISAFADETVMPAFERIDGVASVDATGLVEQQVTVTLDQAKIDALNDKVLAGVDSGLADAQRELREGQAKVADGKAKLAEGEAALESQKGSALDKLAQGSAQVDGASATLSALLSEETTLTANQKAFEAERDGYTQAKQGYEGINTALAGARDTARQAAAAAAKQGVLDSVNALLAQMGRPAVGTYKEAAAVYAQLQQTQPGLPALPDPAVVGEQAAAAVPANVDALLALDDASFEAFKAQAGALPGGEQLAALAKESLTPLRDAEVRADTRLPEVEAELSNITTRLAVISGMKPALEENLKKAQDAYAELEKGKMTAVNELTRGEVTLSTTKTQLEDAEQKLADAQEQFDQARDAAYKKADLSGVLTADMLGNILMAQNFNMPAGYITEGEEQYLVKVGEEYASLEELENTLLMHMDVDGVGDVRLSDVADIALTDNAGESYAKVNGNDGVVLSFQKQSTASTATVSQRINSAIAQLQEQNPGLHITPLMDQGDYIDMVVGSVLSNLLWGGLLAIIVLIFFLKDAKPTFIVACSIPFSLMCAITLMYFTDVTLNIISLSGLALGVGMLVDNSIVVIENIYRLRSLGVPASKAAIQGAKQVSGAIFASTLTTICVFLPIVFTQGISRELFTDMGLTIAYSLLASLVVALTLVPAMGAAVLKNTKEKSHRWFDAFVEGYQRLLGWALRHKAPVLSGVTALLAISIFLTTQMGTAFIPAMDSPQMSATLTMPRGAAQQDAYAMADTVMERIAAVDGVETVGAMSGGSGMSSMMGGSSSGGSITYYILLSDDRTATNADVSAAIEAQVADLDCTVEVQESTMDMSALGGSGVELVITGRGLDEMNAIADDLRGILRSTEGLVDISENSVTGNPETRITVDKYKAMQHGLTVAQIYSELAAELKAENTATTLTLDGTDTPVVVVKPAGQAPTRGNIMDHAFTVTNAEGEEETVRLYDIAAKQETDSVSSINRENGARTMSVSAGVDARHNIGLVSRELEKKLADYELPEGYTVEIAGENETINSAMTDLVKMIALAVVFIYLIMVAQFQSLMSPFIVMFAIPLAFTGGLLALWLTGSELSIIAMLGFLVLAGVVVNNGIVFVDNINQLRLAGMDRTEAILETGRTRIRPVLMTALTTILAMSTMALGIGDGAEMTQPMAIVTIGGLTYATLLTLLVVPVLYDIFRKKPLYDPELDAAAADAAKELPQPAAG